MGNLRNILFVIASFLIGIGMLVGWVYKSNQHPSLRCRRNLSQIDNVVR